MELSSFWEDYLTTYLVKIASDEDYFTMSDGTLKKGRWITMPNGIHVFISDNHVLAGPQETMGKHVDELDWDNLEDSYGDLPVSDEIKNKYSNEAVRIRQTNMSSQKKEREANKLLYKMAAENDFGLIFLNTHGKPSPALKELTKAFASYGEFPEKDSPAKQFAFLNDRMALLMELRGAIKEEDTKGQFDKLMKQYREQIDDFKNSYTPDKLKLKPEEIPGYEEEMAQRTKQQEQSSSLKPEDRPTEVLFAPKTIKAPSNKRPVGRPRTRQPQQRGTTTNGGGESFLTSLVSLLRTLFGMAFSAILKNINKSMKKDGNLDSQLIHSVTKHILSHSSTNQKEKFFDAVLNMVSHNKQSKV